MCAVYHYTDKLGFKFLGLVPLLIPVAWFMLSYPSFVIADRLIPADWKRWQRILYLLISGKATKPPEAKFDRWAVASYAVTALGIVIVSLVSNAGELALIGFFAMLPWVIAGGLRVSSKQVEN